MESESEEGKVIRREVRVPDTGGTVGQARDIGGNGHGITREVSQPTCSVCGLLMGDGGFGFCFECENKVCRDCRSSYKGRGYCRMCLVGKLDLDKLEYKVLRILGEGTVELVEIAELAKATKGEVRKSIEKMKNLGWLEKSGLSVFSRLKIPSFTVDAMLALFQVFRNDRDIIELETKLIGEKDPVSRYIGETEGRLG